MRYGLVAATVLFIILCSTLSSVFASPTFQYSITATSSATSVSITLNISQNLTAFVSSFSLPQVHAVLEGSNSSTASSAVQTALSSESPGAQVNNLILSVDSSAWSSASDLQWFNISLTMTVTGIYVYKSSTAQLDLSWKSFAVPSDISLGGVEVNNIGQKLLQRVASNLAGQKPSTSLSFAYFVRDQEISAPQFPSIVAGLSTLNFSSFSAPLSNWAETYDPAARMNTWTFSPAHSLGMRFLFQSVQGSAVEKADYELSMKTAATIVTPTRLALRGDTVLLSINSQLQVLMTGVIVSVIAIGGGAAFYERRILKKPIRQRRKA